MLVDVSGRPLHAGLVANEFTIQRINEELGRMSELLHIRWMPLAAAARGGGREGRYAFCSYWAEVDKRRQWVREGTYDPRDAFDIIGWAAEDRFKAATPPVAPEECLQDVIRMLHHCDNTLFPWRKRMAEVIEHNKKQRARVKDQALDDVHEAATDSYYHSNRAKRFGQAGFGPGGGDNAKEAS